MQIRDLKNMKETYCSPSLIKKRIVLLHFANYTCNGEIKHYNQQKLHKSWEIIHT